MTTGSFTFWPSPGESRVEITSFEAEQHAIDCWEGEKSARHEKLLLIHTEIMLIKVWGQEGSQ